MPATGSAPAGSTIERLSSKMSWIAAQISSVLTGDHLVDVLLRQPERLLADPPHGDAVGEDADALQRHALARLQRAVHRVGVFGLDADHADLREQVFHVSAMPAIRPPPPTATKIASSVSPGCCRRISMPIVPWPAITSGSSNGWMNVSWRSRAMRQRVIVSLVVLVAVQDHLAAEVDHRLHLDARRGLRHHDRRRDAAPPGGERDALRMVAGRGADHAAPGDGLGKMRDLVVRAAHLEREHRLQVLALEQHGVAQTPAQPRRVLERRLDRDVIHARLENAFEILV